MIATEEGGSDCVSTSLLDLLRKHLGTAGAKKGCDHRQCGALPVIKRACF
jgi:aerobic-type carbon monoxide dehydrogenase small subunit (CoxS/CutS family)